MSITGSSPGHIRQTFRHRGRTGLSLRIRIAASVGALYWSISSRENASTAMTGNSPASSPQMNTIVIHLLNNRRGRRLESRRNGQFVKFKCRNERCRIARYCRVSFNAIFQAATPPFPLSPRKGEGTCHPPPGRSNGIPLAEIVKGKVYFRKLTVKGITYSCSPFATLTALMMERTSHAMMTTGASTKPINTIIDRRAAIV